MSFPKPYPPTPIDFEDWNKLIDALEERFGAGTTGFIGDRTKIVNSRGNIWDRAAGNVQQAIDDVLADTGGAVWLPKGKITETQPWTIDEVYPVHVYGAGMCYHDLDYGTMIRFNLGSGVHCIDIGKTGDTVHFGGLYDMTLFPGSGDRDVVHLDRVSDWHMERVYMNQPKRHGLHVESTGDSWNLWVKDCLIENAAQVGIRLEGGVGAGVILKSYFLNNYFYSNGIDVEAGALDGTSGKVRLCQFHNMGAIFYATGGDAIDVGDDGAANKCSRLCFGPLLIDGQSTTPNGIDLGGYTDHVVIDNFQIWGVTGTAVNQGVNTTNITKGDGYES